MKTRYPVLFSILFACWLGGCKKDLSLSPLYFQPTTFTTEAQLNAQLAAVYGNFNIEQLYAQGLWGYFGSGADEGFRTDAATGVTTQILTETYRATSTDATYSNFWRGCYKGIEQANVIISNISYPQMDELKRKNVLGQAIFLRAYYLYLLTANFGDVVLKTTPTTDLGTTFDLPRTSQREVYNFILSEMKKADTLVQTISVAGNTSVVTQSAVQSIIARVCLQMAGRPINDASKYDEALTYARKVINSGLHSLYATPLAVYAQYPNTPGVPPAPAYSNVFTNNMQNNVTWNASNAEGIWDAAFLSKSNVTGPYANTGYLVTQQLGSLMGVTNATTSGAFGSTNISTFGFSTGTYRPFARLYNLYSPGDLRRDWNISTYIFNGTVSGRNPALSVIISGGNGAGATAIARVGNNGRITAITVENGGNGYTTAPTISFIASAGSGATATATVSGGRVTGITVVNQGSGYLTVSERPIGKWRREYETNLAGVTRLNQFTSSNFPIIRYADVLLMAAEADLQKNGGTPSAQAVEYYNQVRRRAFGAINPTVPSPTIDVTTFTLQDIMDERSRELCFEGMRRLDLVRWGTFNQAMQAVLNDNAVNAPSSLLAAANITANNFLSNPVKFSLFPIPASEILASNNILTQNPGW